MNLDDALARSAPPVAPRSPELQSELSDLVLATEAAARRPRRRFRMGTISLVVTAALGLGTTGAMAGGAIPTLSWLPWVTPSKTHCELTFEVRPSSNNEGEPKSRTYSAAEYAHGAEVARAFLDSYDYSGIEQETAIREYQVEEEAAHAAQLDPAERPPRASGSTLETLAVGRRVAEDLRAHLESQGIPMETVMFIQGWRCER